MSDNFNISPDSGGGFNVFDEWGNFQGKFIPSGGGMDGCLGILTLITVGIVVFVFYIMIKLIIEGFKALFRGDWVMAIVGLSPLWILAILISFSLGVIATGAYQQEKAQKTAMQSIHVTNLEYISCSGGEKCITFTIDNQSNRWFVTSPVPYSAINGASSDPRVEFRPCERGHISMAPGQKTTYVCVAGTVTESLCLDFSLTGTSDPVWVPSYSETVCYQINR